MQPAGRRYRDGLAPDAPALGADWGEASGRRWAMERTEEGAAADPLLFALQRHHTVMHDGGRVGPDERARFDLVLWRPGEAVPPLEMRERQPDEPAPAASARARIAALVPADPVRRYVPQHRRQGSVATAPVVIAPPTPHTALPLSSDTPLPAALPSGRSGRPGRPPPPAGAPDSFRGSGKTSCPSVSRRVPESEPGKPQRKTPGVTAGRDPQTNSPERAARSGAGPDARETAADATCEAVTAGRDRHLLSEPTGGLAPPPAVAPAGPPVLDLDFRDAAGFRWAFVPGGRRRLAEAPSPGGNRALPWPAPGSLPPTATFSHEPGWLMPRLSLALIRAMAAAHYGLPVTVIVSPSRTVAVVRARQAAMWLCRQLTSASLPQIGGAFGGRDHTTVIHAVMVVDALRQRDENFADDLDALAGHIRQSSSPRGRR